MCLYICRVISDPRHAECSNLTEARWPEYIYIMKTMCHPSYHHLGFVANHALAKMMYSYTLLVPMNKRVLNKLSKEHNISFH